MSLTLIILIGTKPRQVHTVFISEVLTAMARKVYIFLKCDTPQPWLICTDISEVNVSLLRQWKFWRLQKVPP